MNKEMWNEGYEKGYADAVEEYLIKLDKHTKRIAELEKEKQERALQRLSDFTQSAEPVAWINVEERKLEWAKPTLWETPTTVKLDKILLYTTPQTKPLSDEEIIDIWDENSKVYPLDRSRILNRSRAIEERHGIK